MLDFLRRDQPGFAAVHFAGTVAPPADGFERLRDQGYALTERRADDALWALGLEHPTHGTAELLGFRDWPAIDEAIRFAANLTDAERAAATGSASAVGLRVPARRRSVLRDRKTLLRIARDVLGEDGLMVLDVSSQLPWSRASLDDELAHDAELDVEALYCIHNVIDDGGLDQTGDPGAAERAVLWQHTHGLAELGGFDIDLVAPDRDFANTDSEMLRAIATMILAGDIGPSEGHFTFGQPGGEARLVPAEDFQREADPPFAAERDAPDHGDRRSVLCEPAGRKLFGFGRGDRPEPLRLARRPPPDQFVIYFPTETTDLMAGRARATVGILRALMAEFAEFEVVAIVKLGYPTTADSREHLWFTAHAIGDTTVDATLENTPFAVDLRPGERAERPLDLLTDWMLMTPAGSITPRSMSAARQLRERADEFRAQLRDLERG
jgi:uncharacterized protein YegJ (DUF2314 family)